MGAFLAYLDKEIYKFSTDIPDACSTIYEAYFAKEIY